MRTLRDLDKIVPPSKPVQLFIQATAFFFEKWKIIALGTVLGAVLGIAVGAHADGGPIPERVNVLCQSLGYAPDCEFNWEKGKNVHGYLTITVDDHLDEPGETPDLDAVHANAVHLRTQGPSGDTVVSQIYQVLCFEMFPQYHGWYSVQQPPCITAECTHLREELWEETGIVTYQGLEEDDLQDFDNVVQKLLWQSGDEEIVNALREGHGAIGTPIITRVKANRLELVDNVSNSSASIFGVPVVIRFALPGPRLAALQ